MTVDDRLKAALQDLDRQVHRHLATSHAEDLHPVRAPRRRRLAPVAAACGVAVLILCGAWLAGDTSHQRGTPPTHQGSSVPTQAPPTQAPPTQTPPARSQSPSDAARDGVDEKIARLGFAQRVTVVNPLRDGTLTRQTSREGVWVVSQLKEYSTADGFTPYGELLLLNPAGDRILRTFPLLDLPPEWVLVTPDAVYCGRQGDGALPDSMVCRVDRKTLTYTARVFPLKDSVYHDWTAADVAHRPGDWSLAPPTTHAAYCRPALTEAALHLSCPLGSSTVLDPVTLITRAP
jgi:hypothetical protein